jgi:L-alanine-DL-glutamate epimerase-like enolase superfamily enzyme
MALHDLICKIHGVPLYRFLGLDPSESGYICITIGIDTIDAMVTSAVDAATKYGAIKVKLGTPHDTDIVREICKAVSVPVRVDPNGGWSAQQTLDMLDRVLVPCGVALLEQPVPAQDLQGLRIIHEQSPIPLIVDESLQPSTLPLLVDRCAGIDVKLTRCGGIVAALGMISVARAFGLKVMMGCGLESSLAITAAAHLTPLADYADLDLHLMLERDPFSGVSVDAGKFRLPSTPGLGVEPVALELANPATWPARRER